MTRLLIALCMLFLTLPAVAVEPDEVLDDPALEARARVLSKELRCLVCQNESIDTSNAPLAKDLRVLVRERLTAGDTDEEVLGYVVSRYGEFVLLKPRLSPKTYLLWGGPLAVFLIGAAGALFFIYRQSGLKQEPLSDEEARFLSDYLDKKS